MARFIIACGGTGGHFYPGYALGKSLRERGHECLFIVRARDPAAERLRKEDLPYAELALRGFPRRPSLQWLAYPLHLAASLRKARDIVRAYRPLAVVGMGGYLSFPVAAAARWRGIPLVLHESNAVLGLANRVCAGWAKTLALGLPLEPERGGRDRAALTGTPIRDALWSAGDPRAARAALGLDPERPTVLVFGGSQGARAVNRIVPQALALLPAPAVQVLHLAGASDAPGVRAAYALDAGRTSRVESYLEDMRGAYAAADFVLCRSGASTLAELIALRKPAILIPYPSATAAHQEANARVLERVSAAVLLQEADLSPRRLADCLLGLAGSPARLAEMARGYARLELPRPERSAGLLADIVEAAAITHLPPRGR